MDPRRKATRELTKLHNNRLVFTTIYNSQQISRADIVRATDLTATTVSGVVQDLLDKGLVEEGGLAASVRGKPPRLLRVHEDGHHLICLDLAQSSFQGAIINLRGEIMALQRVMLDGRTGQAALAVAFDVIDSLLASATSPLLGIGVGGPGIINQEAGIVCRAVNYDWYDLPLRDLIRERYHMPVHIANASHAAVLAEYTFGRRRNTPNMAVVKVGYDVGAGIVLNGELYLGHGYAAGEIGHIKTVEHGERCMCGNEGCLETVTSSRYVVRRARAIARANPGSALNQVAASPEELDIRAVLRAYEVGEPALDPVVAEVGHYLGIAIAAMVGVLSLPYVLVSGSVSNFGPPLLQAIAQEVSTRSLADVVSNTQVETASLGPNIVLLGAAGLLLRNELGIV